MAVKTPEEMMVKGYGQPVPVGHSVDTSEYVNEVGPYDHDLTTHPQYHEDKLASNQQPQRIDTVDEIRALLAPNEPEKVLFERRPETQDGLIQVTFSTPDGDRFGARGKTTQEALENLGVKLEKLGFTAPEETK